MGRLVFALITKQKQEQNIAFQDFTNNKFNINNDNDNSILHQEKNDLDFIQINKNISGNNYSVSISENNLEFHNELDDIIASEM